MFNDKDAFYRRGEFFLDFDYGRDGKPRSPNLYIWWYATDLGRYRSTSTRTADVEQAKRALDAHYLKQSRGECVCPACGRPYDTSSGHLVADAIANYQTLHGDLQSSAEAIRARLVHVLDYLGTLPNPAVTCEEIDEEWVKGFRKWSLAQPIVGRKKNSDGEWVEGKSRPRAPSTTENSVIQLRAAIQHAKALRNTTVDPAFKPIQTKTLNRTPRWRPTVQNMAEMLHYAAESSRRMPLFRYLIAGIGTGARPDAVMELSTDPRRQQWDSARQLLNLNPAGRQQTRKYRAHVKAPSVLSLWLDATDGQFVRTETGPVSSVRSAWDTMREELKLPQEATMKSIRRGVATHLRASGVRPDQVELQLGHRALDPVTELYAPFDPTYLSEAHAALEELFAELSRIVPQVAWVNLGSLEGKLTNVVPMGLRKV